MGKTSAPVRILLTDSGLLDHPDLKPIIDTMKAQGHVIETDDNLQSYQFVVGPNAWYLVPEVAGLFDLAVTQARKVVAAEKKATPSVPKKKGKPKKVKEVESA